MNYIQQLLVLLISVPCMYGMQLDSTKLNNTGLATAQISETDCGDEPITMILGGMAAGGVLSPFYGDVRGIPAGAIVAFLIWTERNPTATAAVWQKTRQSIQKIGVYIEAILNKEHNSQMFFDLLDANNTF